MMATRLDRGESLVELLLAIAILGVAVVGILTGLGALVVSTDVHRDQGDAEVVLIRAAEAVKAGVTNSNWVRCAVPANYASRANVQRPTGWASPTIEQVEYWDGTDFGSTCYDTAAFPDVTPLQRVTVRAVSQTGRANLTLSIVLRKLP